MKLCAMTQGYATEGRETLWVVREDLRGLGSPVYPSDGPHSLFFWVWTCPLFIDVAAWPRFELQPHALFAEHSWASCLVSLSCDILQKKGRGGQRALKVK